MNIKLAIPQKDLQIITYIILSCFFLSESFIMFLEFCLVGCSLYIMSKPLYQKKRKWFYMQN